MQMQQINDLTFDRDQPYVTMIVPDIVSTFNLVSYKFLYSS